jgi:HlyD family secretion protein
LIILGVAIAALGYAAWSYFSRTPETVLQFSGRLETDETDIGAKTAGRIIAIPVREGDWVRKGQVVVKMADEEVNAQLQGLAAQVESAQQEQAQATYDIAVAESRIQEARVNLQQSKQDAQGRIDQATSMVSAAESDLRQAQAQVIEATAQLRQAQAELKLAQVERDRFAQLVAQGAVTQQQFDQQQTALETAQASVETAQAMIAARQAGVKAARDRLVAAQGNLVQVQTASLNPDIRTAQLTAFEQQKAQAEAKLAAAQARVKNAGFSREQIQQRLASFQVQSPIDGIVQDRPLEPGAVVATGRTLLTVIDPSAVYFRGYVPAGELGKIRVGQSARVYLDSSPDQPFHARVTEIDTEAAFTPENIYFKKDRVKQVFGLKLAIEKPEGFAKPGMPADAEIDLRDARLKP